RQAFSVLVEYRSYDVMPCSPCFQHSCLAAALGCLSYLYKQKRFLRERGSDLIRRGMQSINEWEVEERALEAQESRVIEDLSLWGALNELGWSSLGMGVLDLGVPVVADSLEAS
ncbi:hypothetical protein K456DRAFT_1834731, partial [Colletotrichum gloeosporioides 23]